MSNQYFENNPNLNSDIRTISFYYRKHNLTFKTDSGVLSKGGVDFGSSLLLQYLPAFSEKAILEVGCGYGPIGLTIAKANPTSVVDMVDINLRAITLAKDNAVANNVSNINIYESYAYESVADMYDVIITNPPIRAGKDVVHLILTNAYQHLKDYGELWFVIQKKQGALSAISKLEGVFSTTDVIVKDNGYYIVKSTK